VLVRAKSQGLLLAVEPVLDRLQTLGFRMAPGVREAVLRRAGER
jgi:predicted nucleic acid-binding protein